MKPSAILSLCASALLLASCNLKEKYARNNEAAAAWLAANKGTPSTKISGSWMPGDPGWGVARLEQQGGTVAGSIGNYEVDGTVNGKTAYLAMKEGGWVHYSAILRREGKDFVGFYSDTVPFDTNSQSPMLLMPLPR